MAYEADYDLANDGVFLKRVEMALVSVCIDIQAESTATASHAARSLYAQKILENPSGYARLMSYSFSVDGATTAASSDAQLKTRASSIFNAYAVTT